MKVTPLSFAILGLALLAAPAAAQTVSVQGIDSIQLRAIIQPRFDTTTVDGEPSTAWELRRARLGFRMYAAGWIRGDVEGDFARGKAVLTDGFVHLLFSPRFQVLLGQFKKPFDTLMLGTSREGLPLERNGLPRGANFPTPNGLAKKFGYNDRDLGAEWRGAFGAATVMAGFWNGAATNGPEDDDGKQVGARVEYAVPGGWRAIGAWAGLRRSGAPDDPDAVGNWSHAFELAATTGRYFEPGFKGMLQAMFGDALPPADPDADEPTFRTLQAIAAYNIPVTTVPYLVAVEPVVRFGWADPDGDTDDDHAALYTGGVSFYHHRHVKTQVQLEHVAPAVGDGATAFRFQTTLGF